MRCPCHRWTATVRPSSFSPPIRVSLPIAKPARCGVQRNCPMSVSPRRSIYTVCQMPVVRVPDGMGSSLPVLLAARLGQVQGVVLHAHRQPLRAARVQRQSDVGAKRRRAAFVLGHQQTMDPDAGRTVHRFEMEHHPLLPGQHLEFTRVPAHRVKAGIANAAGLALGREGQLDRMRPRNGLSGLEVSAAVLEDELPGPVERLPVPAHQLGARIRSVGHADRSAPQASGFRRALPTPARHGFCWRICSAARAHPLLVRVDLKKLAQGLHSALGSQSTLALFNVLQKE
jgi:hypothetical protein